MQYMIMNYVAPLPSGEFTRAEDMPAWTAYTKALMDAGVMRGGQALHPVLTATTVRLREGQRDVQDGPYANTKEQLGGFYIIEVPDLDAALVWAARNPAASHGAVEVRPIFS